LVIPKHVSPEFDWLSRWLLFSVGALVYALAMSPAMAAVTPKGAIPLDRIVAVVNDDVVTETELDQEVKTVEKRITDQGVNAPVGHRLRSQVLNRLITKQLQLQLAKKAGLRVDDATLNQTMNRIAAQNKMTLDQLRSAIERDGFDFGTFRDDIRDQILITRLKQREVEKKIVVTDQEIDQFIANQLAGDAADDEYRIAHILIAVPESAGPERIHRAREKAERIHKTLVDGADFEKEAIEYSDGRHALDGGDLGWRKAKELPSIFSRVALNMRVGAVSDVLRSPSGFHIIKLVGKHSSERHVVTEHQVRHILLATNDLLNDQAAHEKLMSLRERIQHGEDFGELARAYSEDKASAGKGGQLGWVKPGDVDPDFEKVVEALKVNEVSRPFRTRFGWHIAQVLDKRTVDDTEEYNRAKARELIRKRKTDEAYQQWLRRLRDNAYIANRLDQ